LTGIRLNGSDWFPGNEAKQDNVAGWGVNTVIPVARLWLAGHTRSGWINCGRVDAWAGVWI
jgi:hypothetical protein